MADLIRKSMCFRDVLITEPKAEKTFPVFAKKVVYDEDGDPHDKFVELSEDEKRKYRGASDFMDIGTGKQRNPLPRDKFEVIDEVNSVIDNLNEDDFKD